MLVVLLLILAGVGYLVWPTGRSGGLLPDAQPRAITARGELTSGEQGTIALFKAVSPSVVHVTNLAALRDRFTFNVQAVPRSAGTGFIWDDNGFIVTNYHVVQGASAARVILADRSTYDSDQIWGYADKDLAVIRIKAPKEKLKPIAVGTSQDLQVGQTTLAIGNPFGLDQTLTTGIISALGREIESTNGRPIQGVIQTSAAINAGNSGGPLLDSAGRLIGVNTAILSPSGTFAGIGFAIPVDEVNRVVPQLIAHGKVDVEKGALVMQVVADSPADQAGLMEEDVVTHVGNQAVATSKELSDAIMQLGIGKEVELTVARGKESIKLKARLQEAPDTGKIFFAERPDWPESPEAFTEFFSGLERKPAL
jgi:S1-C subfamily serine protease